MGDKEDAPRVEEEEEELAAMMEVMQLPSTSQDVGDEGHTASSGCVC